MAMRNRDQKMVNKVVKSKTPMELYEKIKKIIETPLETETQDMRGQIRRKPGVRTEEVNDNKAIKNFYIATRTEYLELRKQNPQFNLSSLPEPTGEKNSIICLQSIMERCLECPKPEETRQDNKGQVKTMLRPTVKKIVEIIEKLRILKEKQAAFVNAKGKALDSDKLAEGLATCHIRKPLKYSGSIEELIKGAAGLDANLSEQEPLMMEDILAGRPTKTLEKVIQTLSIKYPISVSIFSRSPLRLSPTLWAVLG